MRPITLVLDVLVFISLRLILSVISLNKGSLLRRTIGNTLIQVLVQKLQDNYKSSLKLGHTDTIALNRCVIGMEKKNWFKWKHYQPDIILLTVR